MSCLEISSMETVPQEQLSGGSLTETVQYIQFNTYSSAEAKSILLHPLGIITCSLQKEKEESETKEIQTVQITPYEPVSCLSAAFRR